MKKIKVFLLFVGLIYANICIAQSGWIAQESFTKYNLNKVHFVNESTGYIVGDSGSPFPNYGILLKTTNGGINWIKSHFSGGLFDLAFTNNNSGYAVGTLVTFAPAIFMTTNAGTNWSSSALTAYFSSISFINTFTGYIAGQMGRISKTTDSGISWNVQTSGTTQYGFADMFFTNLLTGYVIGNENYNAALIVKTTNAGINWSTNFTFAGKIFNSIYFVNNNTGYIAGGMHETPSFNTGIILLTTNTGNNWLVQINNVYTDLNSVFMVNADTGYTAGGKMGFAFGNIILKTTNGGIEWINQPIPTTRGLNSIIFINSEIGYSVGKWGTILKTTTGGNIVSVQNLSSEIPNNFNLTQNYPNPFNPQTKIKFAVPKSSFTKLIIYDLLGREVTTLVNEELKPGTYEADWDGSNFSSGVYFYKLVAGDFVETNKMVLMK